MKSLTIPIHSIVALITNSSSEIFTSVNGGAQQHVISLVNELLKVAGSNQTFDDLFTITVTETRIIVSSKDESNKTAARLLSSLDSLFSSEERYDG